MRRVDVKKNPSSDRSMPEEPIIGVVEAVLLLDNPTDTMRNFDINCSICI